MPTTDQYHRRSYNESEVCELLHCNAALAVENFYLCNHCVEQHNQAIELNYSDLSKIKSLPMLDIDPQLWHAENQRTWFIPDSYKNFDVAKHVLDLCKDEEELQRAGEELLEYAKRDLLSLLVYIKYLVDSMRNANIVWGIGRGSSVASFVLYKLELHRINSIEHELNFYEFMR